MNACATVRGYVLGARFIYGCTLALYVLLCNGICVRHQGLDAIAQAKRLEVAAADGDCLFQLCGYMVILGLVSPWHHTIDWYPVARQGTISIPCPVITVK